VVQVARALFGKRDVGYIIDPGGTDSATGYLVTPALFLLGAHARTLLNFSVLVQRIDPKRLSAPLGIRPG
jgi:hypothetical protein